jgi:hypothetical protein
MKSFTSITCIALATSITSIPLYAVSALSIEDAAKKGLIKLIIKGKGGYTGDVIEMKIQNTSNQTVNLKVEVGRRLDSKDNNQQDILVTKPEEFFVYSKQQKIVDVYGMCCQAHNSCPEKNSAYSIGKLADTNLIKLAGFIDKNKYYTNFSAQQAVWVLSDNNSLASISGGNKDDITNLRNYVSKITGKIIPPYDITYRQESDRDVQGRANKIEGVFEYMVPMNGSVTIGIYDEQGRLVQMLIQNVTHEKGLCKLYYVFRTRNLTPGTYYARMDMDGMLEKEMKIEF